MSEATQQLSWGNTLQGREIHDAAGSRNALVISQDQTIQGEDIVPRRRIELTSDDKRELERLDLPPDQWQDDASIMAARYSKDQRYSVTEKIKSSRGEPLMVKYVMKQIETLMKDTQKGVIVAYFGPGKTNTGDWCFKDGFITVRDIAELYMNHLRGRVLSVFSDCSYAGHWVKQLQVFLDEQGVQPCGHSASDRGILIKLFTSCQSNQVPHCRLYSIRGCGNDKNNGRFFIRLNEPEVAQAQFITFVNSTYISCKNKSITEQCTLKPGYTWHKQSIRDRIFMVTGGRPVWHYVLLTDDQDIIDKFKELTQGENARKHTIKFSDYGQVLKSGLGDEPPNDVKEWIENYEAS